MEKIKLCIFGDICPTEDYRVLFDNQEVEKLFGNCLELVQKSDLSICNFECPATTNETPIMKCGPNLRAIPEDVRFLKMVGIDVLSLANNHIKDFGAIGVLDTLKECDKWGIKYVGAGINASEARLGQLIQVKSKKIGILSFAEEEFNLAYDNEPGANHFDVYHSFDDIRKLSDLSDFTIVLYHGGIEHYKYPSPLLQKKCRKMVDSGADLVLCQHSHCIGTHEEYKNARILYGQGNSIFGYRKNKQAWNEGLVVCVELGEKVHVDYKLIHAAKSGLILEKESNRIELLEKDSKNILDSNFIIREWKKYVMSQAALNLPLLFGKSRVMNKMNRILDNRIMDCLINKRKKMITMNLLRCEAHHEVIQTILEESIK